MISLILFLAMAFIITLLLGVLLEKIRIPWIFAALILGLGLAWKNPFANATSSQAFIFLGQLGMYFLLFIIGFEIDIKKMMKSSKFILRATSFIIPFEGFFGSLIIHYIFHVGWFVSIIVALSFATVGEALLIPILDEFKMVNTKLGQTIIGIGTLDDIFEIITIVLACIVIGSRTATATSGGPLKIVSLAIGVLMILFIMSYGLTKLKNKEQKLKVPGLGMTFLIIISIMFLFIGVGNYADFGPLGALIAGLAAKNFIPKKKVKSITSDIRSISYGFFAPIFFLWVGITADIKYLIAYPLLILLVIAVANSAKLLGSYIAGRKELGIRKSVILGIALSVRFSTSIVVIKLLFEKALIPSGLYSVLIASTIAFKFIVPLLLSKLIVKWKAYKDIKI